MYACKLEHKPLFLFISPSISIDFRKSGAEQVEVGKRQKRNPVYSRHLNGSKLKEVKVLCELNATLSQLVAFLSDIDHYKDAVYRVAEAYVVKRVSDREFYYYSETEMPWPVSNRGLVIRMEFDMDHPTRTLRIRGNNAPELAPQKREWLESRIGIRFGQFRKSTANGYG